MEFDDIQRRVMAMEEETSKLREMQAQIDIDMNGAPSGHGSGNVSSNSAAAAAGVGSGGSAGSSHGNDAHAMAADKEEVDRRSVHVGNVDYDVSADQLQTQFLPCGAINRITIIRDRFTGQPKGFAYIEFNDPASVTSAVMMNDAIMNGRAIKVTPKRTNIPGLSRGSAFRGRGFRGVRGGYKVPSTYYPNTMTYPTNAYHTEQSPYPMNTVAQGVSPYGAPYRGGTSYRGSVRGGMAYASPGFYRGSVRGGTNRGSYNAYTPY